MGPTSNKWQATVELTRHPVLGQVVGVSNPPAVPTFRRQRLRLAFESSFGRSRRSWRRMLPHPGACVPVQVLSCIKVSMVSWYMKSGIEAASEQRDRVINGSTEALCVNHVGICQNDSRIFLVSALVPPAVRQDPVKPHWKRSWRRAFCQRTCSHHGCPLKGKGACRRTSPSRARCPCKPPC